MYRIIRDFLGIIIRLVFGIKIVGAENIPQIGSAVIASNHVSIVDPVAVAVGIRRPIHFMAKDELFSNSFTSWFFHKVNAFPVKRGVPDRSAIRTALQRLRGGHLLGIFPEGTRNKQENELLELQSGASLLAIKTSSPIIPVVVKGTSKLRFRKKIEVIIGKPLNVKEGQKASKEELDNVNKMILDEFTLLLKQDFN